jgi:hypothetical protein
MDAGHVSTRRGPSVAGEGTIRALAEAGLMGLPVDRMILSKDGDELALYEAIRQEGSEVLDGILDSLARKIVKEYADAKERGRKKGKK